MFDPGSKKYSKHFRSFGYFLTFRVEMYIPGDLLEYYDFPECSLYEVIHHLNSFMKKCYTMEFDFGDVPYFSVDLVHSRKTKCPVTTL